MSKVAIIPARHIDEIDAPDDLVFWIRLTAVCSVTLSLLPIEEHVSR